MTHTLIAFLGKGRDNPTTGYRKARYRFADGRERETAFFGLALAQQLAPDCLVLLGTNGSMWDVLIEHVVVHDGKADARTRLIDAVAGQQVSQALLDDVQTLAADALGRSCLLRLIDYGRDEAEQREILSRIARAIPPCSSVSIDVTHAFRHLGMLGLVSAFFLERVFKLDVSGLYYGALDMTQDGVTPVLRLDGLNAIQRWVDALDRFDATGDYGVFCELLERDGVPADKIRCLAEAAFYERTFNLTDAFSKLESFRPVLKAGLAGPAALFAGELERRIDWVRDQSLAMRQRRLARYSLERRDYVRAAIFGWEAFITGQCETRHVRPNDYDDRKEAAQRFEDELERGEHQALRDDYRLLKDLRNALAHGSRPQRKDVRRALASAECLGATLGGVFDRLWS